MKKNVESTYTLIHGIALLFHNSLSHIKISCVCPRTAHAMDSPGMTKKGILTPGLVTFSGYVFFFKVFIIASKARLEPKMYNIYLCIKCVNT